MSSLTPSGPKKVYLALLPPNPDTALSVCPSFHCQVYPYPESEASRAETLNGLLSQIQDLSVVSRAP